MEEIITVDELDVASVDDITNDSRLLIETADRKMKSVQKGVLFAADNDRQARDIAALQLQINTIAGNDTQDPPQPRIVEKVDMATMCAWKGCAGGLAELDENGKVPANQLPSFVDDVLEGYFNKADGNFYNEYDEASVAHDIWTDGAMFLNNDLSTGTKPAGVPGVSVELGTARKYLSHYYSFKNDSWFEITALTSDSMTLSDTAESDSSIIASLSEADDVILSYTPYEEDTGTYSSEITPETGKIYTDKRTNLTYRWGGTAYASLSSDLALGTTSNTAFRGDYGKKAYDHSLARGSGTVTNNNPHGLSKADIGLSNVPNVGTDCQTPTITEAATLAQFASGDNLCTLVGKENKAIGTLITHLADTDNPHSVTKAQVGLGCVENYGRSTAVVSGDDNYITGGAVYSALSSIDSGLSSTKQNKVLTNEMTIDGTTACTVEEALTALNCKEPAISLACGKVLVSDSNGKVAASSVTSTELGQLSGATSNIQTQLDNTVHYCSSLPACPQNRVYGTQESETVTSIRLDKLASKYFELDESATPSVYVPKRNLIATSLTIGSDTDVNVTSISNDFTSVNGTITTTEATGVTGSLSLQRFYIGDQTSCCYFNVGSGDGNGGGDIEVKCSDYTCARLPVWDSAESKLKYNNNIALSSNNCIMSLSVPNDVNHKSCVEFNSLGLNYSCISTQIQNCTCVTGLRVWDKQLQFYNCTCGVGGETFETQFCVKDCVFKLQAYEKNYSCSIIGGSVFGSTTSATMQSQSCHGSDSFYASLETCANYVGVTNSFDVCSLSIIACGCNDDLTYVAMAMHCCDGKLYVCCSNAGWKCLVNEDELTHISNGTSCVYIDPTTNRPMYTDGTEAKCILLEGEGGGGGGLSFPVECCGTAVGDACPVSGIGMTSNMLELYHGRKTEGGINFCQWLYMNDNCFAIDSNCGVAYNRLRMENGCLTNTSCWWCMSCTVLTQTTDSFGVSTCDLCACERGSIALSTTDFNAAGCDYNLYLSCDSLILRNCHVSMLNDARDFKINELTSHGTLYLSCDRVALVYSDTCAGMYFCNADLSAYVSDGTNNRRIALMCDITGGGAKPMPGNNCYSTFADFIDDVYACNGCGGVHGWWNFSNPITLTDNNTGCSISVNQLLGYMGLTSDNTGIFTGRAQTVDIKMFSLTLWISGKAPTSDSVLAPIPGTMYGTASATGINVEGTV